MDILYSNFEAFALRQEFLIQHLLQIVFKAEVKFRAV
jgi:hypothetical protein